MELWHNPRCSKSRGAKEILDSRHISYRERRYLEEPPTPAELDSVLKALGREPWEVARMSELVAEEMDLMSVPHDRSTWLQIMCDHPELIERPILVADDGRAVLGRPPE